MSPYVSFEEWEGDMDRIRANPEDGHLMKHVRERVSASSDEIQRQVYEYLQDMAFVNNPIPAALQLAQRSDKHVVLRSSQDPWWYA